MSSKIEIPQPGTNKWPFGLGDRVKDKINDLHGTVIERVYHMTGCDRFMIELDLSSGTKPEYYVTEAERIELVEARAALHREEVPDIHVELGDIVTDTVSNLTGRVTAITVPLTGAIRCIIDPGWNKKEHKLSEPHYADVPFVVVDKAYRDRPAETKKVSEETKKSRGPVRMPAGRREPKR